MKYPRAAVFVLAVMTFWSTGAAVYFYRENLRLRRVVPSTPSLETAAKSQPMETPQIGARSPTAIAQAASLQSPDVMFDSFRQGDDPAAEMRLDRRDRGMEAMARRFTDPEARAVMLNGMKSQVDRQFGDLFVRLGLNETQVETLRTLLAERQLAQMQAGFLARSAEGEQGRAEAQAWREAKNQSIAAGINAVLGENGAQLLRDYNDSGSQRQAVTDISRRASYAGAPLDTATGDRLVQLLREVEREVPVSNNTLRPNVDGQRQPMTQESISTYLAAMQAQNAAILARSKDILSSSQLEALAGRQLEQYEQRQAQLNYELKNPDQRGGFPFGGGGPGGGGFGGGRGPGGG